MLRYIYGKDLPAFAQLQDLMHRDRADQFKRRLNWEVSIDERGWEIDQYDRDDTLYVIWEMPDGSHGGSMRFLQTTSPIMTNEYFGHLLSEGPVSDPRIWECTRYCLNENAPSRVAAALMLAGGELMRAHQLGHLLGVFDARMIRIYRMIGSSPQVLGSEGKGRDTISVGLWDYRGTDRYKVLRRAAVSSELSEHWFRRSFGYSVNVSKAA